MRSPINLRAAAKVAAGAWAVTALLSAVPAAASACPSHASVPSFHGYFIVDFRSVTTEPDGNGGTVTKKIDHSTGLIHFKKVKPLYFHVGPPGHRRKFLYGYRGSNNASVFTVDDSYADSGTSVSGAETESGNAKARVTIGFSQVGCKYTIVFGVEVPTHGSGNWPYGPGDFHPEREAGITYETPVLPIPGSLHLHGSFEVPDADAEGPTGLFTTGSLPGGAWGPLPGQPPPKASVQWNFAPKK